MKKLLIVIAAVAAIAIAAVAVAGAGAQEGVTGGDRPIDRWVAKVAERLGLGQAEVEDAMQGAQFDLIDERVADGSLTQEEADALKARIEEYGIIVPRPAVRDARLRCATARFTVNTASDVLSMEKDALIGELQSGKTLAEVAEDQGMSVEDFKAALLDQAKVNLDAKVAAGDLTQAQADKLYQAFENHIDQIVNRQADADRHPCQPRRDGPPSDGAESDFAPGPGF